MKLRLISLGTLLLVGCGSEPKAPEVRDVRVPIPEPGARYLDVITPEIVFEPGEDRMMCVNLDYSFTEPMAVRTLDSRQGVGGHHAILLSTTKPQPHGTLWDCSANESMRDMRPLVIPIDLPEGNGVHLPMSGQFVVQFHYVNTFEQPILARDVLRLELAPASEITTWVSTFATNDSLFEVPGKDSTRVTFDCESQQDVDLYLVGGHLHEWGDRFEILVGPNQDELESIYLVDPWRTEFRDSPPVTLFRDEPLRITQGTIIRTICEWTNDTDNSLEFPNEMCAAFGYVQGTTTPWVCDTGGVLEGSSGFVARYTE